MSENNDPGIRATEVKIMLSQDAEFDLMNRFGRKCTREGLVMRAIAATINVNASAAEAPMSKPKQRKNKKKQSPFVIECLNCGWWGEGPSDRCLQCGAEGSNLRPLGAQFVPIEQVRRTNELRDCPNSDCGWSGLLPASDKCPQCGGSYLIEHQAK